MQRKISKYAVMLKNLILAPGISTKETVTRFMGILLKGIQVFANHKRPV